MRQKRQSYGLTDSDVCDLKHKFAVRQRYGLNRIDMVAGGALDSDFTILDSFDGRPARRLGWQNLDVVFR